jgi:Immunity protein 27
MALRPDEADLIGNWIKSGDHVVGDQVEQRIHDLIAHHLKKVATNPQAGGWETLYLDPNDGRYWELSYPHSEMHGGGPRRLTYLSPAAVAKYRLGNDQA